MYVARQQHIWTVRQASGKPPGSTFQYSQKAGAFDGEEVALRHAAQFLTTIHQTTRRMACRLNCPSSSNEIDHRNYNRDDQQEMNQAARHMEAPAEKPENEQNRENCPKHVSHLGQRGAGFVMGSHMPCSGCIRDELLHYLETAAHAGRELFDVSQLFGDKARAIGRRKCQLRGNQDAGNFALHIVAQ